jgi:uncharacterized coiled-coil protein SlyX
MKNEIEQRIQELKNRVSQQRELVIGINDFIENHNFQPTERQLVLINYICQEGRKAMKEIERLEILKKRF